MLAMVPRPVYAVVVLFPTGGKLGEVRKAEDAEQESSGQGLVDPTIFWMKQTVGDIKELPSCITPSFGID